MLKLLYHYTSFLLRQIMKRNILLCIVFSSIAISSFAQSNEPHKLSITPYLGLRSVDWKEQNVVGNAGFELNFKPVNNKFNVRLELSAFGSMLNSQTKSAETSYSLTSDFVNSINTTNAPLNSTYRGGVAQIDVSVPFRLKDSTMTFEPFIGLESKTWARGVSIGDGKEIQEERYKFLSPTLGAKLSYGHNKSKVKLTVRVAVSYPATSNLQIYGRNLGAPYDTDTDLTKRISPSFEIGGKVKKISVKLRYELINLGNSDTLKGISVPDSKTTITGITVGYDF